MKFLAPLACMSLLACSQAPSLQTSTEYIVDFKDDVSAQQINAIEQKDNVHLARNSVLFPRTKMTHGFLTEDALEDLKSSSLVEDIEPVQYYSLIEDNSMNEDLLSEEMSSSDDGNEDEFSSPNDPLYKEGKQWNMTMIGVETAWKKTKGKGVVVAVLDTGISTGAGKYPRVPDLAKTCMKEGYSFVDDSTDAYDGHGHGTHVGGTIAQSTNNKVGVVGVAYQACLMPVKVLNDQGSGRTDDIAEAIIWATDNGAEVINMSLGGGGYSQVMANALKYAASHNVFVACAAGNAGRSTIEYPAAMDGCHAISSVGKSGNLAFYSSYGTNGNGVFISAPGGDQKADGQEGGIWQDTIVEGNPNKHGFFPFQGTSMATPHVAGAAALVISQIGPDKYNLEQVENALSNSATQKKEKNKYGSGILNVASAVAKVEEQPTHHSWFREIAIMLACAGVFIARKITR